MSRATYAALALASRQTTTATTTTGAAVDLQTYDGKAYLVINCTQATAGTTPTATFSLTASATEGGVYTAVTLESTPAVVTDAANGGVQIIEFDIAANLRWYKAVCVTAGTNTPTFQFGAVIVGNKQYQA
jgi:hypothetical protein